MGDIITLSSLPWGDVSGFPYRPNTQASVSVSHKGYEVMMRSYETVLRKENTKRNSMVCQDSCLEFFFSPVPDKGKAYINFEVNPLGTMYTGFSYSGERKDSIPVYPELTSEYFNMRASITEEFWQVDYTVPFDFIKKLCPDWNGPSKILKANFYKCGDLTEYPHYIVWKNIETPLPDFHVPEFFGDYVLI